MEKEEKIIYCKSIQRPCSLIDLKAWHLGESIELKKWIGFGFFNHIFVTQNRLVRLYYDLKEGDKFHEVLNEKLTEDFFDEICDKFFELIEQTKKTKDPEELFQTTVKLWPAWTIFDVVSKYPDFATQTMLQRLIRIRTTTEAFSYELAKRLKQEPEPERYIFFKGKIIQKPFNKFINENKFFIKTLHG